MDKGKIKLTKEIREITKSGIYASVAGPRKLDIDKESQEGSASAPNSTTTTWVRWGKNDKYPQEVVNLNIQDTTSAACLNFKIKAHYGKGLFLFKKEVDSKGQEIKVPFDLSKNPEIEDFLFRSDIENYLQGLATDFEWWNWAVSEFIPTGDNKKVHALNRIPVINTRLGKHNNKGRIEKLFVSGDFGKATPPTLTDNDAIAVFDKIDFFNVKDKDKKLKKWAYIHKQPSVDRSYYPLPMWQSNNNFLNLSLEISDWILSNINNSINIKYHIEYPMEYFEALCPQSSYKDDNDWKSAIKREKELLFTQIDEYLSGTQNVGKFLHTYTMAHPLDANRELSFKINVVENKTNHEAYLPAFDTSAAAIANAHNAPLQLVGLSLSKGMGAGSGSDIRESFNFYMQLHTEVPRQTTLEALYLVKKINNWPKDLEFGYRNIVFDSINNNKSGYAIEAEGNQTTTTKE